MKYAHLYRKAGGGWVLTITDSPELCHCHVLGTTAVNGKRQARADDYDMFGADEYDTTEVQS
jgi:hypothetical protein